VNIFVHTESGLRFPGVILIGLGWFGEPGWLLSTLKGVLQPEKRKITMIIKNKYQSISDAAHRIFEMRVRFFSHTNVSAFFVQCQRGATLP
jgi:hypothetical protein